MKKTREGKKAQETKEGKEAKEEKPKKKVDDDEPTEEEVVEEEKKTKQENKGDSTMKMVREFFFEPNGKDPKWENIGPAAFLMGAFGYYLATRESPS